MICLNETIKYKIIEVLRDQLEADLDKQLAFKFLLQLQSLFDWQLEIQIWRGNGVELHDKFRLINYSYIETNTKRK